MLFLGIDIGTQGVRGIAADREGKVLASASEAFAELNCAVEEKHYEQKPEDWWAAASCVIHRCMDQLREKGIDGKEIRAVAIDGTSGTILPVDSSFSPLCNALMYNDMRSAKEAEAVHRAGAGLERKLGLKFNASFALPKIVWIRENRPDIYEKTAAFVHQADYIVGKLSGEYRVSDYSNALKSGFDLVDNVWPDFIEKDLGIDRGLLPEIKAPGVRIAEVSAQAAAEFGFGSGTVVAAGATDGYSSALATGAVREGDWASIIGTTLVLKGVTKNLLADPSGSSYSHKLPSGYWMLGGAANIGGRCLNDFFSKDEFDALNITVEANIPTGVISYPLHGRGERFPFLDPEAACFFWGDISRPEVRYAAIMEGVAYAERLALERMEACGARVGSRIYTTGGACRSEEWMKIRASVLNRELAVPEVTEAAMGTAILAASTIAFDSLEEASEKMIRIGRTVQPEAALAGEYEEIYQKARRMYEKVFSLG